MRFEQDMTLREKLASLSPKEMEELLRRLAAAGLSDQGGVEDSGQDPAVVASSNDIYPATYAQILFWRQYQAEPDIPHNHQSMVFRIHGSLDAEALRMAFEKLSESQPALRTVLLEDDRDLWQHLRPSLPIPMTVSESAADPSDEAQEAADREAFLRIPFDLEREPPIRVRLVRHREDLHILQIVLHHIATDGRSKVILLEELSSYYNTIRSGGTPSARMQETTPGDIARKERAWLAGQEAEESMRYWRERPLRRGLAHPWTNDRECGAWTEGMSAQEDPFPFEIDPELTEQVQIFASDRGMTSFQVMVGCYFLSLHRLMPGHDITIGMPVDMRRSAVEQSLIGCLINTVPVCMDRDTPDTVGAYLELAANRIREAIEKARVPLIRIWEENRPEDDLVPSGSWRTILNFKEDYAGSLCLAGASVEEYPYRQYGNTADLELTFPGGHARAHREAVRLSVTCHPASLPARQANMVLQTWRSVMRQCVDDPFKRVSDIDILLPGERERIIDLSGKRNTEPYPQTTLHAIFRDTAHRYPDRPAVIEASGTETSYAEMQVQVTRVAAYLRTLGIAKEEVVAIHLQRSPALLASLLGILEAGGAFLLLEPSMPPDRLRAIAGQARVRHILSEDGMPLVPGFEDATIRYNDIQDAHTDIGTIPTYASDPSDLACVIFTSGSTGVPKGAMLEHRNLTNYLYSVLDLSDLSAELRTLQKTLLSFDLSLFEWLLPMFGAGSAIIPEPEKLLDFDHLAKLAARHRASHAFFAPAQLKGFLESPHIRDAADTLRFISCGGESMPEHLMRTCLETLSSKLFHIYGPAECAVWVSRWESYSDLAHPKPPIGTPNANVDILIIDALGRPAPPGMPGELWIGGAQTGRGYIHNPEETRKRFVDDPLKPGSGRRYYRTGDLAQFLPDGNILFLGRMDDQVKVRGVRIELGDVSAGLLRCEGVREAVVLPEPDGEGSQRLRAWITLQQECTSGETEIRSALSDLLPTYMVPFRIHVVDSIPLTPHGKTDHRALRALAEKNAFDTHSDLPLETETQRTLAALWSQLLGVEVRHRDADFFRLGGHSLLALRLAGRIRQELDTRLSLSDFYADGRLEVLAEHIDAERTGDPFRVADLPPLGPGERIPMSAAQRRMWMLQQLLEHPSSYHISLLTHIPAHLAPSDVRDILLSMAECHTIHRTRLWQDDDGFWQEVLSTDAWQLDWAELFILSPADESRAMSEERERPFELSDGPGWRARWIVGPASDPLLLLVFHHALVDEWSMNLLRRELSERLGGAPSEAFVRPAYTYADFARWQQWANTGAGTERLETYWKDRLSGMGEPVRILPDMSRPDATPGRSALANLDIGEPLRALMDAFVRREGISRFAAWMAVWQILQARLGSGGEVLLATPVSERAQPEWLDVVGMCLNTLPIRARVDEQASFRAFSRESHRALAADIAHAQLPYEDILRISDLDLGPDTRGLPQVMFVLHGEHEWDESDEGSAAEAPRSRFAKNPLTIHLTDRKDLCRITLEYDADRFLEHTVEDILRRFEAVVEQVLREPDMRIGEVDILLPAERERIRTLSGRDNMVSYPLTTLHAIFRETAERYPDRPAVIGADGEETSYAELQKQVLRVAACLRSLGIAKEEVVAVHLQRSPALLASMLGILEAGGAFLLLEPSLPLDRLRAIAEQARVRHILSDAGMPLLPGFEENTVCFRDIPVADKDILPTTPCDSDPSDLACVIFTSGSTGVPKGAMLEHVNLTNYLYFLCDVHGLGPDVRTLQKTLLSFDLSLYEMLVPMTVGGAVVMAETGFENDPAAIFEAVVRHQVRFLYFAPAQLKTFLQAPEVVRVNGILRTILSAGEALGSGTMRDCLSILHASLSNAYGPAEAGAVTQWVCHDSYDHTNIPIGPPNPNVDILILDAMKRPLPPGMPGELWIGGIQTGRGYIHNEEETRKRFVDDPIEPGSGRRYYRTGDLARFLPDGNILFLGRMDDQVKVRGVRIELGDVSAGLLRCEGVREVVVLPEPDGEGSQRLRAWVTCKDGFRGVEAEIRSTLAGLLPMYMLPFRIHVIDSIPLTPHGKTDHRSLRSLAEQDAVDVDAGLPFENETQRRLAVLWSQLLGVEVHHRDADFFRLGGNSLHLMRLQQRIQSVFTIRIPLQRLLHTSVLQDMATAIDLLQTDEKEQPPEDARALLIWDADGPGALYFCGGSLSQSQNMSKTLASLFPWTWKGFHLSDPQLLPGHGQDGNLEDSATTYAETIMCMHTGGPIVVTGFCLNGLDAYATACHLQRRTNLPIHVLFLDTHHPEIWQRMNIRKPDSTPGFGQRLRNFLDNLVARCNRPIIPSRYIQSANMDTIRTMGAEATRLGLIDADWYLSFNRDLTASGIDPVLHYLTEGWREERMPSPWFHDGTYEIVEPEFRSQHPDPVRHFLAFGVRKPFVRKSILTFKDQWSDMLDNRLTHGVFDEDWYVSRYPAIPANRPEPLKHYLLQGWREKRRPSVHFNHSVYADLCRSFDPRRHNPVMHYLLKGRFDKTVEKAVGNLRLTKRQEESILTAGWFDAGWYVKEYPGTAFQSRHPLQHYMSIGWKHDKYPIAGFDPKKFQQRFPDFKAGSQSPLHFLLTLDRIPPRGLEMGTDHGNNREALASVDDRKHRESHQRDGMPERNEMVPVITEAYAPIDVSDETARILQAGTEIRKAYRPGVFSGAVHIMINQHQYDVDPNMGWDPKQLYLLKSYRMLGDHDTMLSDELRLNAPKFKEVLEGIFGSTR